MLSCNIVDLLDRQKDVTDIKLQYGIVEAAPNTLKGSQLIRHMDIVEKDYFACF